MKPNFDVDKFMDDFTDGRILAIESDDETTVCPNCGSEHFEELLFERGRAIGCTDCE